MIAIEETAVRLVRALEQRNARKLLLPSVLPIEKVD